MQILQVNIKKANWLINYCKLQFLRKSKRIILIGMGLTKNILFQNIILNGKYSENKRKIFSYRNNLNDYVRKKRSFATVLNFLNIN